MEEWTGVTPERAYVDRGYRGHNYPNKHRVFRSGQKRGVHGTIKRELRRRAIVEPVIGHLKTDSLLGRNYLKGQLGDKQNAQLSAAGYNFRLLLNWFRQPFLALKSTILAIYSARKRLRTKQRAISLPSANNGVCVSLSF